MVKTVVDETGDDSCVFWLLYKFVGRVWSLFPWFLLAAAVCSHGNTHTYLSKPFSFIYALSFVHWMFSSLLWGIFRRREWNPTPVLLPGKSHGWKNCSPWGCWELDTTQWLHFHFSLSCIGEGNDNPLQCSCLENPRDGGVWWAAVYGVAQSRTRLKQLNSSSSSMGHIHIKA